MSFQRIQYRLDGSRRTAAAGYPAGHCHRRSGSGAPWRTAVLDTRPDLVNHLPGRRVGTYGRTAASPVRMISANTWDRAVRSAAARPRAGTASPFTVLFTARRRRPAGNPGDRRPPAPSGKHSCRCRKPRPAESPPPPVTTWPSRLVRDSRGRRISCESHANQLIFGAHSPHQIVMNNSWPPTNRQAATPCAPRPFITIARRPQPSDGSPGEGRATGCRIRDWW
ncbi:hypothetical protein FsymDg_2420 [Candidatus Protofrankia datiscae]|uniref:Uncharacterized protein n=1 Tax=Candidatus Protofrankia datiscae TaxID=2716812 RepID=F8B1D0_9ACTN|nr:hypothetical protein FsymDg_2420 [Candidatus Protofrankia datiscae]